MRIVAEDNKSGVAFQRVAWDALRRSINGVVNKVSAGNIRDIIPELLNENLVRGRGLFCRAIIKSQLASPAFTDVFAALVAVVNTKFPAIGRLLLTRIVLQIRRAYTRNDKHRLAAALKFVAHLVNHMVVHEVIALEMLEILLAQPTDDGVEVAAAFVTQCGAVLQDLSPKALQGVFDRFHAILLEGQTQKRLQFLIEDLFAIRRAKFQGYAGIRPVLDLVDDPGDQTTHVISIMDDEADAADELDIFRPDPNYLEEESRYESIRQSILGEDEDEEEDETKMVKDETETHLVDLRRVIYLTIMSSVDFEEAGHKLLNIKLEPGQEMELCIMLLECCSQERSYLRYYGLLGQRLCMISKLHQHNLEKCFVQQYSFIHQLETTKLRNVAMFFAHLLATDSLSWNLFSYIRLTEDGTTSSSRIFLKILIQELCEHLGIPLLNQRFNNPDMTCDLQSPESFSRR